MIVAAAAASATAAVAAPCADCVLAGAASVPLRVPAGAPLAGYGALARRAPFPRVFSTGPAFWFRPAEGTRDNLRARALVVTTGDERLVWLTADLVGVDGAFTDEVRRQLSATGLGAATVIVSASHTHSGPGGFARSRVMGFVALDRYDDRIRAALVESLVEAARRAAATAAPARVSAFSVDGPAIVKSRLDEPLDREIIGVGFSAPDGTPRGLAWTFAIHGTMLGPGNRRFSADVMGVAAREIERRLGAPALFVNGAEGDVSPERHGAAALGPVADALAASVVRGWSGREPLPQPRLATATASVPLGRPALSLRACLGRFVPRGVRLPLDDVVPRDAQLTAVALGDVAWVAVPGEMATRLGLAIKAAARGAWRHAFVAGLSNDYVGYLLSARDDDRAAYVTCASLYGRDAGDRVAAAVTGLLERLAARRGQESAPRREGRLSPAPR